MFHVGQRVVCVDDKIHPVYCHGNGPIELHLGKIYTISHVSVPHIIYDDVLGVHVAEVDRPFHCPFGYWRFSPLIEKKTDISAFEELLLKKPTRVTEDA